MGLTVVALLVLAAFGAGLVDSIAGGGGLITFPALVAAGLPPHLALGTNKGQAVSGAISSAVAFWRGDGLHRDRAAVAFAAGFTGSVLGAFAVLAVPAEPLRPVVIVLLAGAAAVVLLRGHIRPRTRAPSHPRLALAGIAVGLGAYDGFFGPGVGSMLIVAFMLVFGDSITRASGNAKVVNLASNLAAVIVFTARGTVLWRVALPMAVANGLGAAVGARLALKRGDRFVRWVVLAVVAAAMVKLGVDFARAR
ncbi:MAG TPA: TSUP family transporter [Solirubrobacteraceae bacterium]